MVQQYISTSTVNNVVLHVLHSLVMVAVVNRGQHPMKTVTKNVTVLKYSMRHGIRICVAQKHITMDAI